MQCIISESTKALGFKSRNSLYQLEQKGVLKDYLSTMSLALTAVGKASAANKGINNLRIKKRVLSLSV